MKLNAKTQLQELVWGLLARVVNVLVPVQKGHWIFASDYGRQCREGSKYLLEYMLREHSDYHCTFVTRNSDVRENLSKKGIPCVMNFSWKGILSIARAEAVFFTQYCDDVYFAYRKPHRKYYFLIHGMPYKRAFNAVPDAFKQKYARKVSAFRKFGAAFRQWLVLAFTMDDVKMVSCCSEFNQQYMPAFFGTDTSYPILGMPRNDALFQEWRMKEEQWIDTDGKFVVTYMPTHRAYGKGKVTPTPFVDRPDIQQWMTDNKVIFVMKNHPNMVSALSDVKENPVIRDISKMSIDPQVAIWHSDVLVTDYSSVWMDYLLLNRPILFYYYDNYEEEDEGLLFSLKDDCPGHECSSEDELFALIRQCRENPEAMRPSYDQIRKYHKFRDGLSCQRHFEAISQDLAK
jgi:CDP-glycerol glycerophosphotransferase (TagB/SpsB family)